MYVPTHYRSTLSYIESDGTTWLDAAKINKKNELPMKNTRNLLKTHIFLKVAAKSASKSVLFAILFLHNSKKMLYLCIDCNLPRFPQEQRTRAELFSLFSVYYPFISNQSYFFGVQNYKKKMKSREERIGFFI